MANQTDLITCEERDEFVALRRFLVPLWVAWSQSPNAFGEPRNVVVTEAGEGMCRFTSAFLALALKRAGWRFDGGSPDVFDWEAKRWTTSSAGGGFRGRDGRWHGHHWVRRKDVIVDLTAAQFGDEPVLITSISDPRYRSTLNPLSRSEALRDVSGRAKEWHALFKRQLPGETGEEAARGDAEPSPMRIRERG